MLGEPVLVARALAPGLVGRGAGARSARRAGEPVVSTGGRVAPVPSKRVRVEDHAQHRLRARRRGSPWCEPDRRSSPSTRPARRESRVTVRTLSLGDQTQRGVREAGSMTETQSPPDLSTLRRLRAARGDLRRPAAGSAPRRDPAGSTRFGGEPRSEPAIQAEVCRERRHSARSSAGVPHAVDTARRVLGALHAGAGRALHLAGPDREVPAAGRPSTPAAWRCEGSVAAARTCVRRSPRPS